MVDLALRGIAELAALQRRVLEQAGVDFENLGVSRA
jgi:hypothetical protein